MSLSLRAIDFTYPPRVGEREGVEVLRGLSLDIARGQSVAIMAPSGAGKTTLLAIAGMLLAPSGGQVLIDGEPVVTKAQRSRMLAGKVAWVLQTINVLTRRSAIDNVVLPLMARGARRFEIRDRAVELLGQLGLDRPDAVVKTLSGGQAQRVGIARALMGHPSVLVADEPTANLDLHTGREVMARMLAAADDAACLIATHDPAIAAMADTVVRLGAEPEPPHYIPQRMMP